MLYEVVCCVRSKSTWKCSLFRTIGPPRSPPNWLRRYGARLIPTEALAACVNGSSWLKIALRTYSKPSPWNRFVPHDRSAEIAAELVAPVWRPADSHRGVGCLCKRIVVVGDRVAHVFEALAVE